MDQEKKPLGHEFNFGALVCETVTEKGHTQKFHAVGKEDEPFLYVDVMHSTTDVAYYRDPSNNHHTAVFRFREPMEEVFYIEKDKEREPNRGLGYLMAASSIEGGIVKLYTDKERTKLGAVIGYPEGDGEFNREVCYSVYQDEDRYVSIVVYYTTFRKRSERYVLADILEELKGIRKLLEDSPKV